MGIKNVALVGANGTLGPHVLRSLLSTPQFTVSILNRQSSKSKYDPKINILTIPDDLDSGSLVEALNGQDALIMTIKGSYVAEQKKFVEAAFQAGVKRVIPAEFGSCDSADDNTNEVLPLMKGKKNVRDFLIEVCNRDREGGKMTWTSLVTGHFFDHGLEGELLKFDVKNRKAYLVDGGDVKFSGTNLNTIGDATVKILEKEEETKNKLLYVHSFSVTQNEVLAVLEKVTGTTFEKSYPESKKLIAEARPKMLAGDAGAVEETVAVHGVVASDWRGKEGFANQLLGLNEDNLEETVRKVVQHLG